MIFLVSQMPMAPKQLVFEVTMLLWKLHYEKVQDMEKKRKLQVQTEYNKFQAFPRETLLRYKIPHQKVISGN